MSLQEQINHFIPSALRHSHDHVRQTGNPSSIYPPNSMEDFLDDSESLHLPYDLEISEWSEPEIELIPEIGSIETSVIKFLDGSRYVFRKTVPANQKWDTSVDFTLPLATRVKGFNTYMARKFAEQGIHTRIIGTNQKHGFDLSHDAQAMLHILNEDDRRQQCVKEDSGNEPTCKPGESILIGYSMGEMKALVALGLAQQMGRDIKVSLGMDPCLADAVDYNKELKDLKHLLGLAAYLGREAIEVPIILSRNLREERSPVKTLRRFKHLASTVGLTPNYVINTYDKWNILATGETGECLSGIPQEAVVVIHFFDKSYFNDNEVYQEKLGKLPHFRWLHEDGLHLSGANPRVIERFIGKVNLAQELIDANVGPDSLANALTKPILTD